jgi:hypothetical protein
MFVLVTNRSHGRALVLICRMSIVSLAERSARIGITDVAGRRPPPTVHNCYYLLYLWSKMLLLLRETNATPKALIVHLVSPAARESGGKIARC